MEYCEMGVNTCLEKAQHAPLLERQYTRSAAELSALLNKKEEEERKGIEEKEEDKEKETPFTKAEAEAIVFMRLSKAMEDRIGEEGKHKEEMRRIKAEEKRRKALEAAGMYVHVHMYVYICMSVFVHVSVRSSYLLVCLAVFFYLLSLVSPLISHLSSLFFQLLKKNFVFV